MKINIGAIAQLYNAAAKFGLAVGEKDLEEHLNTLPDEIHAQVRRLTKIYRLKQRGIGGEQENAARIMEKQMKNRGEDFKNAILQICKDSSYKNYSTGKWTSDKGVNDVCVVPMGEGETLFKSLF